MIDAGVIDRVVKREVIEHGLLALLDGSEVGVDGPIPCARTGNSTSFRTEVDSPCSCANRRDEGHGAWHEAGSPKCHREPC
jgi:hypothetical protein